MTNTEPSSMPSIAFVGIGRMGSAMLRSVLDAGHRVTIYDPSKAATDRILAERPELVRVASSAREAASEADVVDVIVNTNEQALDACAGPEGVFAGARVGTVVLLHSTVSHETLRLLEPAATARGVHLLDAPVSGADGQKSAGDLAVMVGGDESAFARAKPVMDVYGGLVLHLGPLGAGMDAKLAINAVRYLAIAASDEVARFAAGLGIEKKMSELVAHTASNRYLGRLSKLTEKVPLERRVADVEIARKDMLAAIARATEIGVAMPSVEATVGLIHRAWGVDS